MSKLLKSMHKRSHRVKTHKSTGYLISDDARGGRHDGSVQPAFALLPTDYYTQSVLLGFAQYEQHQQTTSASGTTILDAEQSAADTCLLHYSLQPIAAFPSPAPAAHLTAMPIQFELAYSDIVERKPYLDASTLHIYIPTTSTEVVIMRMKLAAKRMGDGGVYDIDSVLGFLGETCVCGQEHWREMGWNTGHRIIWPDQIGVNRKGLLDAMEQLRRVTQRGRFVPSPEQASGS